MKFITFFDEVILSDVGIVGGKNASLGHMIKKLQPLGINIPFGFATTADAYRHFLDSNNITTKISNLLAPITTATEISALEHTSATIRRMIEKGSFSHNFEQEIISAYQQLSQQYNEATATVAVRSSATAEDLPTASFAGQQESFLNISGNKEILAAIKKCMSSLFTPRAIIYRIEKGFSHDKVALSVGIQKMILAQTAGVAFTIDTETSFKDVVVINAAWGLGESVVQGTVNPDTFYVHKPTLKQGFPSIIRKQLGSKKKSTVPSRYATKLVATTPEKQSSFCLSDDHVLTIARQSLAIEDLYSTKTSSVPMDIEWIIEAETEKLYIVQARPETISASKTHNQFIKYSLAETNPKELTKLLIVSGQAIGQEICSGTAQVVTSLRQAKKLSPNDILVTSMTDPDWVPIMKRVKGIITDLGGRTCHAAIVARELGVPAVIGTTNATKKIMSGDDITIDCSHGSAGSVYQGNLPFKKESFKIEKKQLATSILLNIADPDKAFALSFLPVDGVGLARMEFIFSNTIKAHPMALLHPEKLTIQEQLFIKNLTKGYASPQDFFISVVSQEVATIAAAFYPRPVTVRFSDLKSNEYSNLIGGKQFEPKEENPMLGLRGASRYYNALYEPAFRMECAALKKAISIMGLSNIQLMIPFVRTTQEAHKVLNILAQEGLTAEPKTKIFMMCEIPSNVILLDEFAHLFDGFSIGSNDLTQFTLAVDRDSSHIAQLYNEQDKAVLAMVQQAITKAHSSHKCIGICGQAPSDFPEFLNFLLDHNIDSISLNIDAALELFKEK
jgi:pyruvate,water dikinase